METVLVALLPAMEFDACFQSHLFWAQLESSMDKLPRGVVALKCKFR